VPIVLTTITEGIEDIDLRLAQLIGKVAYKLSSFDLHTYYKEQFIEFFLDVCNHKDLEMRRHGAYNLACFNQLFKDYQEENGIDF